MWTLTMAPGTAHILTLAASIVGTAAFGPPSPAAKPAHSQAQLSQARGDFAATAAGGAAVFGGGCSGGSSIGPVHGGACVRQVPCLLVGCQHAHRASGRGVPMCVPFFLPAAAGGTN